MPPFHRPATDCETAAFTRTCGAWKVSVTKPGATVLTGGTTSTVDSFGSTVEAGLVAL